MASFTALASSSAPVVPRCRSEQPAAARSHTVSSSACHGRLIKTGGSSSFVLCRPAGVVRSQARQFRLRAAAQGTSTEAAGPVTESDWEEKVLKSPVPVIVDFWAPWCGPCRMIAPMIDEIAAEYGEKIRAFKLNTDESPSIATDYGIRSIPTVMVFKGGKKMDVVIGAVPKSTLVQSFDKFIE